MIDTDFIWETAEYPFPYNFSASRAMVPDVETAHSLGITCYLLVDFLASRNGVRLSPLAKPYELLNDSRNFSTVPGLDDLCAGDVLWHGLPGVTAENFEPHYDTNNFLRNWRSGPSQHMSIFTGQYDGGEPVLLHASFRAGRTTLDPLSEISVSKNLRDVTRIGRFVVSAKLEQI